MGEPLGKDSYADIYKTNLRSIQIYSDNPGLMACLRTLTDELEPVGELTRETYARWRNRLARNLTEWSGASERQENAIRLTAYALSVMTRELLHDLYVRRNPALTAMAGPPEGVRIVSVPARCTGSTIVSVLSRRSSTGVQPLV